MRRKLAASSRYVAPSVQMSTIVEINRIKSELRRLGVDKQIIVERVINPSSGYAALLIDGESSVPLCAPTDSEMALCFLRGLRKGLEIASEK